MNLGRNDRREGQGQVEYALLLALVGVAVFLLLYLLGLSVADVLCAVLRPFGAGETMCAVGFYDDFTDMDAWDAISGDWYVKDGKLCSDHWNGKIFNEDVGGEDYQITVDGATLYQGNGYGVFFRVTNTPDFDGYSFQYDPGYRAFIFRKWVNGYELPPFAVSRVPGGYDWYAEGRKIVLDISGDTFAAKLDGETILTGSDDSYEEGGVGLRTWDATEACFDGLGVN